MTKSIGAGIIALLFLLTACGSSDSGNQIGQEEIDRYEVSKTRDQSAEGDFTFRLISEKEEYEEGEDVTLYGEIEYTGEQEEITIQHSSSAVLFPMEEKVRGYEIGFGVDDLLVSTTLKRGEPYREDYIKSGGYSPEQDPEEYIRFMEDFLEREDFPAGYYVVDGFADFFVPKEDGEDREAVTIEGQIDFKVYP